jgi:hypothetical protein
VWGTDGVPTEYGHWGDDQVQPALGHLLRMLPPSGTKAERGAAPERPRD